LENGYKKDFLDRRRRYLEGRVVTWYGKGGKVLTAKAKTEHEAADKVFEGIFTQRNRLKHNEMNLSHKARYEPGKNHQLRDDLLLSTRTFAPLQIWTLCSLE
jgi:hypothetical protein